MLNITETFLAFLRFLKGKERGFLWGKKHKNVAILQ